MMISFGWTERAFRERKKTVTRRDWPDSHARKFPPGSEHVAYNKQACWGGKPIGRIQIVSIRRESLNKMIADPAYGRAELKREGDLWDSVEQFVALFQKAKHGDPYRIEFRILEIRK